MGRFALCDAVVYKLGGLHIDVSSLLVVLDLVNWIDVGVLKMSNVGVVVIWGCAVRSVLLRYLTRIVVAFMRVRGFVPCLRFCAELRCNQWLHTTTER